MFYEWLAEAQGRLSGRGESFKKDSARSRRISMATDRSADADEPYPHT